MPDKMTSKSLILLAITGVAGDKVCLVSDKFCTRRAQSGSLDSRYLRARSDTPRSFAASGRRSPDSSIARFTNARRSERGKYHQEINIELAVP